MKKEPLSVAHPDLAIQWHPKKNDSLTSNDVTAGSGKKVWWQCSKNPDHEWIASIVNRSRGRGCPECSNKKVSSTNSLTVLYPEIAKMWHPTKNRDLTPDDVVPGSHKKVWWQCSKNPDHEWEAVVKKQLERISCRACRSLSLLHPDLAKQWHPTKNGVLTPNDVAAGSHKKVWWQCPEDESHQWVAGIQNRVKRRKCPRCRTLASKYPDLAKQWHPTKNEGLTPSDLSTGTKEKVWWQCQKDKTHVWDAPISSRVKGSGCPKCSGRDVTSKNSLFLNYPELAKQWHPTKNGDLTPNDVTAGSHKKVWWQCPEDESHQWAAVVKNRVGVGRGCPFCSGQKVCITNSLSLLHPDLAKQWHPTKNGDLTPNDVTAGSSKKVWWQCLKKPDHKWDAVIGDRVNGNGCPQCNLGWTPFNIRYFVQSLLDQGLLNTLTPAELFLLAQQAGLVARNRNRSEFVKALISGRLDPEELEEFAEGSDSAEISKLFGDLSAEEMLENSSDVNSDTEADPEVSIQDRDIKSDDRLPDTTPGAILDALESQLWSTADKEAVEFLISSGIAKLWRLAYDPERLGEVKKQTATPRKAEYAEKVRTQFRDELNAAESLPLPPGYNFRIKDKLIEPNLMQRHVAVLVKERRRVGNWSGTGAGKTLSAVLASRVIEASLTVILCPNAVVEKGWQQLFTTHFLRRLLLQNHLHQIGCLPKSHDT
jgi:uncharacterized protein YbcI